VSESADHGPYIGRALPRLEDERLVTGEGRYTDDVRLPDEAHAVFVRSPHAHAAIRGIDPAAARGMPGVLAVLTGADYRAAGLTGVRQIPVPADVIDHTLKAFGPDSARPPFDTPQWPLAIDKVRYVGEPLAVVVAETPDAARDAAAAVAVDYDVLPAVTDARTAIAPGAPVLHDAVPDNIALEAEFGDRAASEAAFARAEIVIEHTFRNQRIVNAQMEPRAALGAYDATQDRYTLISGSQGVHRQRTALAECFGVAPERVRVICPDVGGAFGLRTNVYPEQVVVVWAARQVGRPVRWTGDRSECFLSDLQGRDLVTTARLALDRSGRILTFAVDMLGNAGAHPVSYVPLNNGYRIMTTVYDIPAAHARIRSAFTSTMPTATYRGAGRPESHFVLERLIDMAAARLGIDRLEIRRRNLIRRAQLPYRTAMGLTYDSGDFRGNMRQAATLADWGGVKARKRAARKRGKRVGIGIASYVEAPVGAPHERVRVTVHDGAVDVHAGTQSTGQGHETTFAQVLADRLGIAPHLIRLMTGDTDALPSGGGSHSDRSMRLAGALLMDTSGQIVAQARSVFAALAAVDEADVTFDDGAFGAPRSNLRLGLFDIARAIDADPNVPPELRKPLTAEATFTGRLPAHPTGCAVCEVEVDPATGAIEVTRYASVDDAGQPINPLVLHGQVHGGIVQGLGQALTEAVAWDGAGQVLNASFMDYAVPRADGVPDFQVALSEDPTSGNALRVKGGGEAGITPALAAAINAVVDALSEYGVTHVEMPATPARVWEAINSAVIPAKPGEARREPGPISTD
jgi:carbon-monoxide dehydrogenase large subunit